MYVGDNSSVLLECRSDFFGFIERQGPYGKWYGPYGGGATYSSHSTINQQLPAELRNRLELVPTSTPRHYHTYSLRINAFSTSDEGNYTCMTRRMLKIYNVYVKGK
jgi:hypothetical protein